MPLFAHVWVTSRTEAVSEFAQHSVTQADIREDTRIVRSSTAEQTIKRNQVMGVLDGRVRVVIGVKLQLYYQIKERLKRSKDHWSTFNVVAIGFKTSNWKLHAEMEETC